MRDDIIDFIIEAISSIGYPVDLSEDSNLIDDAGLDSLDIVDISAMIEDEYDIKIDDTEYGIFKKTIAEIADLIMSKL